MECLSPLNRVVSTTTPRSSHTGAQRTHAQVLRYTYNIAGLLTHVEGDFGEAPSVETKIFVESITYSARRERLMLTYGNGKTTRYTYDSRTFRLARLVTGLETAPLQDFNYVHDPVGNITTIDDNADQSAFISGTGVVSPDNDYVYDSIYRLIEATGREHPGLLQPDETDYGPTRTLPNPNDTQALVRYTEEYTYDAVGNIREIWHGEGATTRWRRNYDYETTTDGNRLLGTSLPGDDEGEYSATYEYDEHGNMVAMPHLPTMDWNPYEELQHTVKGAGSANTELWFQYDAAGQRVRKIVEHYQGSGPSRACTLVEERLYLGGAEVHRIHRGDDTDDVVEREVQTLSVMDDERRIALVETRTIESSGGGTITEVTPRDARVRFLCGNHLGSASLELDDEGDVISYEETHPYGTSAFVVQRSGEDDEPKRYRFTGMERDETGLQYHSARYFSPWLGRWTSPDPSGLVDGINGYQYCSSSPVVIVDPSGRWGLRDALRAVRNQALTQAGQVAGLALHVTRTVVGTAVTVAALATPVLGRHVAEQIGNQIVRDSRAAYRREGGGGYGVLAVVNQFNPVYHALVEGHSAQREAEAGHHFQAGLHLGTAAGHAADAVMMAAGAAQAITRTAAIARRTLSTMAQRMTGRAAIERTAASSAGNFRASSLRSSGHNHSRESILQALTGLAAPGEAVTEGLNAISSGRAQFVLDSAMQRGGAASPGEIRINPTMAMEDVVTVFAHEARHLLDMSRGRIPNPSVATAGQRLVAELRAFTEEVEVATNNGLTNSHVYQTFSGVGDSQLAASITHGYDQIRKTITIDEFHNAINTFRR